MPTTIGRLLVGEVLPEGYKDIQEPLTTDNLEAALQHLITKEPDKYRDVSKKLLDLGGSASFEEGVTLNLSDALHSMPNRQMWLDHIREQQRKIEQSDATDKEKSTGIGTLYNDVYGQIVDENYSTALAKNNPFAMQVKSKARGNKLQLAQLMATPGTFQDAKGRTIPVFIGRSYAEGLKPAEYWAATYGARKSVKSTKFATREAGELGKQMVAAAMRMVVTSDDCGTPAGIPVKSIDPDNIGAVLARPVGNVPAGTVITKEIMNQLKGEDQILVRSPITCGNEKGICKQCAGIRETGRFPEIGAYLGISAASALAERIAQGALNVKHCLIVGTQVLMKDLSSRAIEDLMPGDDVYGVDLKGNARIVKVVNVFDNGPRELWNTTFRCGQTKNYIELGATLDHKLLAMRHVTNQTDEMYNGIPRILSVGQKSRVFNGIGVATFDDTASGLVAEPMALLCGLLLGDGCYTKTVNGVYFSCADDSQIAQLQMYMSNLGLKFTKLTGHDYYYRVSLIDDPLDDYRNTAGMIKEGARNHAKVFLIKNSMYGKHAQDKVIPEVAYSWNNKAIADLVAGLVITDGSIYKGYKDMPCVSFCSTSKRMVEQLKQLLQFRLGIYTTQPTCTCRAGTSSSTFNHNFDQWQITITTEDSMRKFITRVSLFGIKAAKLKEWWNAYMPTGRSMDYFRYYRIKQQFIGIRPTYDIEVDHPDHLFVLANGLVVSNSGGQTSKKGKDAEDDSSTFDQDYGGFDFVEQFTQIPASFKNRAALATAGGTVSKIEPAPQGGTHIHIGDQIHYALPDQPIKVKVGDEVEAGDRLSGGLINPAEITTYKGLGEGRRYFTERLTKLLRSSGWNANRRNVEVLSRSLLDHVTLDDDIAGGLTGDNISYSSVAHNYKPRPNAVTKPIKDASGMYLETPMLHYTIGTRVDKGVADTLNKFGIKDVNVHPEPPAFTPFMPSLRSAPFYEKDWMAQLGSSYLESNLLKNVHRGAESTTSGLHPIPGIAKGVDFEFKE